MRFGIIGAGIAGLSCATELTKAGHEVVLFDKGRGPGGRMSTKRLASSLGEISFDYGAQYLTARDPDFVALVERWESAGLAARWSTAGDDAWVGTPAMKSPLIDLALPLQVHWGRRIEGLTREARGWLLFGSGIDEAPFDGVIVAVPAEQVPSLIAAHRSDWSAQAIATPSDPCWTVMAAYGSRLPIASDRLTKMGVIGSAVRNSAMPGRASPEAWVLQATAEWSGDHIEDDPDTVVEALLKALADELGLELPTPVASQAHRWRFAKSGSLGAEALWDGSRRLGLCGDWLIDSRVEAAWLSGKRLGQMAAAT